ncbi:Chitinase 4 [Linum perenne]
MAKFSPRVAFFLLLLAIPLALAVAEVVTTVEVDSSSPCQDEIEIKIDQPGTSFDQVDQEKTDQLNRDLDAIDQAIDQFNADFDEDSTLVDESDVVDEQYDDQELNEGYIVMPTDDDVESDEDGKVGIPVGDVVTQAFFNSIINKAAPSCKGKRFYTRQSFLNAARSYPQFGQLSGANAKREIAAFFAHVTHETGSLCYIEEIQKSTYCDPNAKQWPCAPGKQYFGRGPLQLTWNYNYGPCGRANRFDGLKNPEIVARNPTISWRTALWYWMKNVRPVVGRGFGATIRAINGALECNGKNPAAVNARVKYYQDYCRTFKVAPGPNLRC